jgi:hypothetical protein
LGISHERGFFWVHVGCESSGKLRPVEEQKAVLRSGERAELVRLLKKAGMWAAARLDE